MRSNLDDSRIETLMETGQGDADRRDPMKWCLGINSDAGRGQIYRTQKGPDNAGQGRIFRANMGIPRGQSAHMRTDIEVLFDGLPEPIDPEFDLKSRAMYWTDRGDPPRGNTVNRAPMGGEPKKRGAPEILVDHVMEAICVALDLTGKRMFLTDFGGSVYSAKLDRSDKKTRLYARGNLTGTAYAELPVKFAQTYSKIRRNEL